MFICPIFAVGKIWHGALSERNQFFLGRREVQVCTVNHTLLRLLHLIYSKTSSKLDLPMMIPFITLQNSKILIAVLQCFALVSFGGGSTPFFDNISHTANRYIELDYGGQHPFEAATRKRTLEEYDELQDASKQDTSYSIRDSSFTQLRIKFDTRLLESRIGESLKRDNVIYEILNALPVAVDQWARHLYTVSVRGKIAVEKDVCFGIFGDAFRETSFGGADLVILVSAEDKLIDYDGVSTFPVCGESTLALASACTLDQFDRPIVGFMNFCLDYDVPVDTEYLQDVYQGFLDVNLKEDHVLLPKSIVAAHELAHVLGASSWMFKYFRDDDGTPRTPRPFERTTIECAPGSEKTDVFPSSNTITSTLDPTSAKVVYNIITPRVSQVAKNLLGCNEIEGARLADGAECYGSHWHERLFLGELLGPVLSSSSQNILSPLTLALMEDTGWYRVDYRGVEIPAYGLGAGCEFSTESCIQNDEVPEWGRDMFCDIPLSFGWDGRISPFSLNHIICDPSHRWWTLCDLWDSSTVPESLSVQFAESSERYFSNENLVTSFDSADSCPIAVRSLGYDCTRKNDDFTPYYAGEVVGENSRCVVASYPTGFGVWSYRPACMSTRCDPGLGKLIILLDGSEKYVCQNDGDTIQLDDGSELICPRLSSICPHLATCPAACSGRGVCNYNTSPPTCICHEGEPQNAGCYPEINVPDEENLPTGEDSPEITSPSIGITDKVPAYVDPDPSPEPAPHPDTFDVEVVTSASSVFRVGWVVVATSVTHLVGVI